MNSHLQPNKISEQLESSSESGSESSTMQVDESSDSQSEGGAEFREVKMSHEFKSPPSPVQQPRIAVDTNFLQLKISQGFVHEAPRAAVISAVYTTIPDELDFLLEFKQDTKDLSRVLKREKRILIKDQATKMKKNMTDYQAKKL